MTADLRPESLGLSEARYHIMLEEWYGRLLGVFTREAFIGEVISEVREYPARSSTAAAVSEWVAFNIVALSRSSVDLVPRRKISVAIGLHSLVSADCVRHTRPLDAQTALMYIWSLERLFVDYFARVLPAHDDPFGEHPKVGIGGESVLDFEAVEQHRTNMFLVNDAYMWFDEWGAPEVAASNASCRDALWQTFCAMLDTGHPVCEYAAWHGINHQREWFQDDRVDRALIEFLERRSAHTDLCRYARGASRGRLN